MTNPYNTVIQFEEAVAKYCGSPYAVAVESCTSALFLSLMYRKATDVVLPESITIPSITYPGVACSIIHAGFRIHFDNIPWHGEYLLNPMDIWDAALRFRKNMYHGGLQCLSFHIKKLIPIGRGGMILTDDIEAVHWLRKARFDGRNPVPLQEDHFSMLGWNMYMEPSQAARGIQLLQALGNRELEDLNVEAQGYPDLSKFSVYGSTNIERQIKVGDVYKNIITGLKYTIYYVDYATDIIGLSGPGHPKKMNFAQLELDYEKI